MLAVVIGCVALLAVVPVAHAAGTSKISGKVEEKLSNGLSGVDVEVLTASNGLVASVETKAGGEYTVSGLAPGTYRVRFVPPLGSVYAPQYYSNAASFLEATSVPIAKEGETKENINALLHEGGKISGKVEGPRGEPLSGIEVFAVGEESAGLAYTNGAGVYTVQGLVRGSYRVEFSTPFESESNLVPQFYLSARSFSQAKPVEVKEEETKPNINARLQEGGEISGTVTDAATHAPLGEVCVSATNSLGFEFFGGSAVTTANGKYAIHGLEQGSYNLEFAYCPEALGGVKYFRQLVNGVFVSSGRATGINVALVRRAPVNTVRPELLGTPALGQILACSTGTWTGVQPFEFTYVWLRDGSPIGGATGNTYIIQPADQGQELACRVTAKNSSGSASATSNTLKVPAPTPTPPLPPPPPTITNVTQSHSSWREGGKLAAYSRNKKAPLGTTFKFVLNQQATVSFAFTQQVGGRRVKGKCVAQTRANRRKPSCKRAVSQGTLSFSGHSGLNTVAFQGRVSSSKKLPLGSYSLRLTAVNSARQRSNTRSLNFTIVR